MLGWGGVPAQQGACFSLSLCPSPLLSNKYIYFKLFIYLFMIDTEREAETQAEEGGEVGSLWGARYGTRSQDPRITP